MNLCSGHRERHERREDDDAGDQLRLSLVSTNSSQTANNSEAVAAHGSTIVRAPLATADGYPQVSVLHPLA